MATQVRHIDEATRVHAPVEAPRGIWGWLTTVDHKRIGVLYLITSLTFFGIGGIEALLLRVQLSQPNNDFVSAATYNQLFTMHGTTMIFLAIMPLSAAFFNLLVPLMIGARDVAFPRLNAFSYWAYLFGAILINLGWLHGGAPDAGWFAYANLTSPAYSPGLGVDYWVLGIQVLGISSVAASFNFFTTIVNMRAPGMSMMRLPVFVWMTLVTQVLIFMAFPALTIGATLLLFDRWFGTNFFIVEAGGMPLLWQHLFWVFGHPEVYILILPAMGIVSEVLPTFSRKPLFGYTAVVFAGIGIAVLGFSVWAHHMFTTGLGPVPNSIFAISTMLIALPTGVKIFNWIGTMWGGALWLTTSMLFSIGFVAMFIIGGLSGVMHASPPVDSQQQDTYFVVAHFHYVLFGGSIMGLFSGIYYWFPKFSGKMLSESLGKINFWLMLIGFNLTFFPMHWLGVMGMPRRIYSYGDGLNWGDWNMFVTMGSFIIGLSFIIFIANVYVTLTLGEKAPDNPWDGATLEWATSSPPSPHNFDAIPIVKSRIPLWTDKYPEVYGHESEHGEHGEPDVDDMHTGALNDPIHLPNPSYWPIVVALGILLLFAGFIFTFVMSFIGVAMMLIGIWSWALEPAVGSPEHA